MGAHPEEEQVSDDQEFTNRGGDRLVPRWITVWGLAGIPLYVAALLLAMYGTVGINSAAVNLLCLPLAVQEMVLAVWMIARGFRPAVASHENELVSETPIGAGSPRG